MSVWRRFRSTLAKVLALSVIAILGIGAYVGFHNWRVIPFTPACQKNFSPGVWNIFPSSRLDFLDGRPTKEFWQIAIVRYRNHISWRIVEATNIEIRKDRIFTTWSEYFRFREPGKKFEGEREEWFHAVSKDVAEEIFRRRQVSGQLDGIDLSQYKVARRYALKVLHADQCGFMEELIMKGGRFAGE
jgi:hypothetical protein